MAIGTPTSLGSANSKTSSTTITMQASVSAPVGDLVIVSTAWNNNDATTGETNHLSISDESSNTWTKIKEHQYGGGGGATGANVASWYTVVTTQIDATDDITITADTSHVAKAVAAEKFPIDASTVEILDVVMNGNASGGLVDLSLSGLQAGEKLLVHAIARESSNADSYTKDADYTELTTDGSEGGGTATNMNIRWDYRIATVTSDTNSPSGTIRDHSQIYFAIAEVAGGPVVTLATTIAGVSTVSSAASITKTLAFNSAGISTVSFNIVETLPLAFTVTGISTVAANIVETLVLALSSAGIATVSPSLTVIPPGGAEITLATVINGVSTAAFTVTPQRGLATIINGTSTVSANLVETLVLATIINGVSTVSPSLSIEGEVIVSVEGTFYLIAPFKDKMHPSISNRLTRW